MNNKPISIALEDAKQELIKSINEISNKNGLSFYLLNILFTDIYNEIQFKAKQELENDRKKYIEKEEDKWKQKK